MNKLRNKKAFTLMEMLIVVAIIAVLVAISIPVLTNTLEKAREATDLANIRSKTAEMMVLYQTGEDGTILTDTSNFNPNTVYHYKSASYSYYICRIPMKQKEYVSNSQVVWTTNNAEILNLEIGNNEVIKGGEMDDVKNMTYYYDPTIYVGSYDNLDSLNCVLIYSETLNIFSITFAE